MSSATKVAPRRLTKKQAAAKLLVPVKAVNRMIENGELKTVVIPNTRNIILESSVDAMIDRLWGDERQAS